jgi:hypothetical protein
MSRLNRQLLAVALLAFATFARAESLRLVAPANGTTLRGGSFAELRWSATELPASAEEWEAFLSIDGGRYYAFRVTPHLEVDLRSFTFIVPNVETRDARILIRVGDEVHETQFETRGTFSITRDRDADQLVLRLLHFGRGEAARDGDPAVLSWTDGPRDGSRVTERFGASVPAPSASRLYPIASDTSDVLEPAGESVAELSIASTRVSAPRKHARKAEPVPVSVDLLLVCSRRNI